MYLLTSSNRGTFRVCNNNAKAGVSVIQETLLGLVKIIILRYGCEFLISILTKDSPCYSQIRS